MERTTHRGRPFVDEGRAVLAGIHTVSANGPDSRADMTALAERWFRDARAEHASIASFARTILELMAVGAPLDLLDASQRALADEIRHARACLALAEAHAGTALAFGPLPALAPRGGGLRRVALDTFEEGCVSETISAIEAGRAADDAIPGNDTNDADANANANADAHDDADAKDASYADAAEAKARVTLVRIAEDEAAHAALAWRTLAWALAADGTDALRNELRARADELRRAAFAASPEPEAAADVAPDAARSAWEKVIDPTLADLLDGGRASLPAS